MFIQTEDVDNDGLKRKLLKANQEKTELFKQNHELLEKLARLENKIALLMTGKTITKKSKVDELLEKSKVDDFLSKTFEKHVKAIDNWNSSELRLDKYNAVKDEEEKQSQQNSNDDDDDDDDDDDYDDDDDDDELTPKLD